MVHGCFPLTDSFSDPNFLLDGAEFFKKLFCCKVIG
jgi:hypothetical protein